MDYMLMFYEGAGQFEQRKDRAASQPYWAGWQAYVQAMHQSGVVKSGAGLQEPGTGTTVRVVDGKRRVQDGPFADTKEQLGGFFVIDVPDLDTALSWAARAPCAAAASRCGRCSAAPGLRRWRGAAQPDATAAVARLVRPPRRLPRRTLARHRRRRGRARRRACRRLVRSTSRLTASPTPEAWLLTTARRRLHDRWRHGRVEADAEATLTLVFGELAAAPEPQFPDERLKLLFICAHPAIDRRRAALMLQTVLGLDAARIASAFLVAPATLSQRLVRAKTKIRAAAIAFEVPGPDQWASRLADVIEAIYAAYGTGWDDVAGTDPEHSGLAREALTLAAMLAQQVGDAWPRPGACSRCSRSASRARRRAATAPATTCRCWRRTPRSGTASCSAPARRRCKKAAALGAPRLPARGGDQSAHHAALPRRERSRRGDRRSLRRARRHPADDRRDRQPPAPSARRRAPPPAARRWRGSRRARSTATSPYWAALAHLAANDGDAATSRLARERADRPQHRPGGAPLSSARRSAPLTPGAIRAAILGARPFSSPAASMCQLLGMNANTPTDVMFSFTGFATRAEEHKDGFGIAFFEDKGVRLFVDTSSARDSPVAEMVRRYPIKSDNVIAHIRKATQGRVALENAHPFVRELWGRYWAFAHNGDLKGYAPRLHGAFRPGRPHRQRARLLLADAGARQVARQRAGSRRAERDARRAAAAGGGARRLQRDARQRPGALGALLDAAAPHRAPASVHARIAAGRGRHRRFRRSTPRRASASPSSSPSR